MDDRTFGGGRDIYPWTWGFWGNGKIGGFKSSPLARKMANFQSNVSGCSQSSNQPPLLSPKVHWYRFGVFFLPFHIFFTKNSFFFIFFRLSFLHSHFTSIPNSNFQFIHITHHKHNSHQIRNWTNIYERNERENVWMDGIKINGTVERNCKQYHEKKEIEQNLGGNWWMNDEKVKEFISNSKQFHHISQGSRGTVWAIKTIPDILA